MSEPRDSLVLFTDRDLGLKFPRVLSDSGLIVERHADHFRPDCPDDEWLEHVGRLGWVAITRDRRIRYKPNEIAAVRRFKVRLLVVIGQAPFAELAANFVRTTDRIQKFVAFNQAPWIAKVYRPSADRLRRDPEQSGRVERWYP